jgi:uroporphyrinogen decarboxylase
VDYLPSQITFSDRTRDDEIAASLGLSGGAELEQYLENHICITLSYHDKPLFYRNDREEMARLAKLGCCGPHWDAARVYDAWGIGIEVGSDGFFACFSPLSRTAGPEVAQYMVPGFNTDVLYQTPEEAVRNYVAPDPEQPGIHEQMADDLARSSGDFLVVPSGYFGIYERGYALLGFESFMTSMAQNQRLLHELLDKITDYKVEYAKKVVEMGFKVAHHGDDLGTQTGTLFSPEMFHEFLLPRLKRAWQPYNDAGIPIIMHSCGVLTQFLPELIDIGLRVLEPVQPCMDLAHLKREFGRDLVFWGGIETQNLLPFGTPEQVKGMTRETIRTLGKGGGHIIAPSQEIMNDVPLANVKALVETIVEERQTVLGL